MIDPVDARPPADHTTSTLAKLASALDLPVQAFTHATPSDLGQTIELLRLWRLIADGGDRAQVLAYVRETAQRV